MFFIQSLALLYSLGKNFAKFMNLQKYFRKPNIDDILNEIPTYYFTMDYALNNIEALVIPSRCSAVIFKDLNGEQIQGVLKMLQIKLNLKKYFGSEALQVVDKITETLQQLPQFVLLITQESYDKFASKMEPPAIPWITSKPGGHVISVGDNCAIIKYFCHCIQIFSVCPDSGARVDLTVRMHNLDLMSNYCPKVRRELREASEKLDID